MHESIPLVSLHPPDARAAPFTGKPRSNSIFTAQADSALGSRLLQSRNIDVVQAEKHGIQQESTPGCH